MNYLPLILVATMLFKNSTGLKDLLSNIDLESLSPLLSLTGLDASALENLLGLLNGNLDLKSVLPMLLKTFSANSPSEPPKEEAVKLNPIKDIASPEILSTLGNYFEN